MMRLSGAGLSVAVVALASLLVACDSRPVRPFEPQAWARADLDTSTRSEMVGDLLRRQSLKGMTRAQVLDLLGPPTPTDKWDGYDLIYVLGPDLIDHEWLLIRLDAQGLVSEASVRSD